MIALNDAMFNLALKESNPLLVSFGADWCKPCKAMEPLLEECQKFIATVKVNVEQAPLATNQYKVRSLPTTMVLANGNPLVVKVGSMTAKELQAMIVDAVAQINKQEK